MADDNIRPDAVASAAAPGLQPPPDEEEYSYQELRKRYLEKRKRTNEEIGGGQFLRTQTKAAVFEFLGRKDPRYRALLKEIKRREREKTPEATHAIHVLLYRYALWEGKKLANFFVVSQQRNNDNDGIAEMVNIADEENRNIIDADRDEHDPDAPAAASATIGRDDDTKQHVSGQVPMKKEPIDSYDYKAKTGEKSNKNTTTDKENIASSIQHLVTITTTTAANTGYVDALSAPHGVVVAAAAGFVTAQSTSRLAYNTTATAATTGSVDAPSASHGFVVADTASSVTAPNTSHLASTATAATAGSVYAPSAMHGAVVAAATDSVAALSMSHSRKRTKVCNDKIFAPRGKKKKKDEKEDDEYKEEDSKEDEEDDSACKKVLLTLRDYEQELEHGAQKAQKASTNGFDATVAVRVDQLLLLRSDRTYCPVTAEVARTTTCKCLCDLRKSYEPQLRSALTLFLGRMAEKSSADAQRTFANEHLCTPDQRVVQEILNQPKNRHYLLPVSLDTGARRKGLLLCRSAIVELTRAFLGTLWSSTQAVFPTTAELDRKKKKRFVFQILNILLKDDVGPGGTVNWNQPAFTQLNMSKDTAKHHVTKYKLRKLVQQPMIRSLHHHSEWVQRIFRGFGHPLSREIVNGKLPILAECGSATTGWVSVHPNSVGGNVALSSKCMQFHKIECKRVSDKRPHQIVQDFMWAPIAAVLGVSKDELILEAAFLRSLGYVPQIPHFDFKSSDLLQYQDRVFIGLTPLMPNGLFLQVWDRSIPGSRGHLIFIPYGYLLILPGDIIYGGGFQQCFQSLDLHLRFYIYVRADGPIEWPTACNLHS